jgi:hypothetical protein
MFDFSDTKSDRTPDWTSDRTSIFTSEHSLCGPASGTGLGPTYSCQSNHRPPASWYKNLLTYTRTGVTYEHNHGVIGRRQGTFGCKCKNCADVGSDDFLSSPSLFSPSLPLLILSCTHPVPFSISLPVEVRIWSPPQEIFEFLQCCT